MRNFDSENARVATAETPEKQNRSPASRARIEMKIGNLLLCEASANHSISFG
jgi:hypothetical protein